LGAVFGLHGLVAEAQAVDAGSPEAPELRRELDGHIFIPSRFTPDPFVQTSIASETGFGYGWAQGKTFDVNGNPVSTAAYQVGAFAQLLEYQYGFLPWWAVRVGATIVAYSGLNSAAAAGIGTSAATSVNLGTTLSWKVGDNLRFGGSVDVVLGPAVILNVVQAVVSSINSGEIVSPVNSYSKFTFQPTFVGAWAINKPLGLTFSLGYIYANASSTTDVTVKSNLLAVTTLLDFDMSRLGWVPIGFIGGLQTQFSVADTNFLLWRYQFGIFYTGVKQLNVGAEFLYQRAPIVGATSVFLSSFQMLIDLQYNFN
jgi:hypothetical protein